MAEPSTAAQQELERLRLDLRRAETLDRIQLEVLEQMAGGESLPAVLEALVRLVESEAGMRGSVLLAEDDRLRHGAAPNLPAAYNEAIDGVGIGPTIGSCGAAAHFNEVVIVDDLETHPNWTSFLALARAAGLRACWSHPIRGRGGAVLGTFALYYDAPRRPEAHELKLVERAAYLAGIAIMRSRSEEALHLANEELTAQAEELHAQAEELAAANDELRRQAVTFSGVMDSAVAGILVATCVRADDGAITDFHFIHANPQSEKITGLPPGKIVGNTLLGLFPANKEAGLFQKYVATAETGVPSEAETYYTDGRLNYWVAVSCVKVGDGVAITFSDITVRKETEERLRTLSDDLERQRRFAETMIERLPAGVAYIDKDFVFRVVNPRMAAFYGHPVAQVVDRPVYDVLPGAEAAIGPIYDQVRATLQPLVVEAVPVTYKHGEAERLTHWDATVVPYLAPDGAFEGWLVLALEVTERLVAQAHKDQFLAILSHELRTPINAIMGFASVLDDGLMGEMTEGQHRYMGRILEGADRLLALITDLLDMSSIQAGRFSIVPEQTDIWSEADDVVGSLRALADQNEVRLELSAPGVPATAWADPQRIGQVLMNLVGNAIKFTPAGGTVGVAVTADADQVRVEVRDSGIGIAPAHHVRIFEAFTQVDMTSTRRSGGTGLGLAISKRLVEAHGGQLGVVSAEGEGATFWFTLPRRAPA